MKLIMIIGGMAQGKHAFAAQFTHARCIDGLAAQIRDARLDEYLRAHRDAMAGGPAALPGGAPRIVEVSTAEAPASR